MVVASRFTLHPPMVDAVTCRGRRRGLAMRYIIAVIAALILNTACYAQDWGSVKFITGLGNNSCGKYLAAVHGHPPGGGKALDHPDGRLYDDHFRYMAWLSGFFSGANWWVMDEHNQLRIDNAAVDVGSGNGASR